MGGQNAPTRSTPTTFKGPCSKDRSADRWLILRNPMRRSGHVGALPLVLFDLVGTLVDSNYLHTVAWSRAIRASG